MAKSQHIINEWYLGESQDSFIDGKNTYLYSEGLEGVTHPAYLTLAPVVTLASGGGEGYTVTTTGSSYPIAQYIYAPNGAEVIQEQTGKTYYNTTDKSATITSSSITRIEYLYSGFTTYKWYAFDTASIYRLTSDMATLEATTAHNDSSQPVTAVLRVNNTILFSKGFRIYSIDYSGTVGAVGSPVISTILYGSTVVKMYFYNDVLYVYTTLNGDTIVYLYQYTGTTYSLLYRHTIYNAVVSDIEGVNDSIYWVSTMGIHVTQGNSSNLVFAKNINYLGQALFSSNARITYTGKVFYISDGTKLYRYGSPIPGMGFPFVHLLTTTYTIELVKQSGSQLRVIQRNGTSSYVSSISTGRYQTTGSIISRPYYVGGFWMTNNLLSLALSYQLLASGGSIVVAVQTDKDELVDPTTFTTIRTITAPASSENTMIRIDKAELLAAGINDFNYLRFKITLTGGDNDAFSRPQKTPRIYELVAFSEEINQGN